MNTKRFTILLIAFLMWTCALYPAFGQQRRVSEYQVKAAFLYNFAKFVDWPACESCEESRILMVGILGDDPFGKEIQTIDGKRVKNKVLQVVQSNTLKELQNCDVLFISSSAKAELPRILEKLKGRPVLTVSDTKGFAHSGVMINLFNLENKIRFEVNPVAVEQSGLKISSQLLKLATIVEPENAQGAPDGPF